MICPYNIESKTQLKYLSFQSSRKTVAVKKVLVHEKWAPSDYTNNKYKENLYDIAIIFLKEKLVGTPDKIKPICLPNEDIYKELSIITKDCRVSGWGLTSATNLGEKIPSENLKWISMTIYGDQTSDKSTGRQIKAAELCKEKNWIATTGMISF